MVEPFEILLLLLLPLLLLELRIFGTFDTLMEIELLFGEDDTKILMLKLNNQYRGWFKYQQCD